MEKVIMTLTKYIKGEEPGRNIANVLIRIISSLYFFLAIASFGFLVSILMDINQSKKHYFTVNGLIYAFGIVVGISFIYLVFLLLTGKLSFHKVTMIIIVLGIALRFCYMFYTGPGTRSHDVFRDQWGHLDYIKHIAKYLSLPPVNICQTYHPPVHHIISAAAFNIGNSLFHDEVLAVKVIQALMAIINSFTILFFYKILKCVNCNSKVILFAVAVFCFHPTLIYFASKINNDNTVLFFYTISFYYLLKWINAKSIKNIIGLAVFTSMAILTKWSAVLILAPIGVAFLVEIIECRHIIKTYIRQYAVFSLIFLPLAFSYQIRNYILFKQGLNYIPSFGQGFTPSIYNLFYIPIANLLKSPFNQGGLQGGEFFFEFLIKSSLFGEWSYPGLEDLAALLVIVSLVLMVILMVVILLLKKEVLKNQGYIFLLNLFVPLIIAMKFRMDYPVACSQDFRYIAPVLISVAYFLGIGMDQILKTKYYLLNASAVGSIFLFCLLSTVLVLVLGFYG